MGRTEPERRKRWRVKVRGVQDEAELNGVRQSLQTGRPLGAPDWIERMAKRLGIDWNPRRRGRPPKAKRTDADQPSPASQRKNELTPLTC